MYDPAKVAHAFSKLFQTYPSFQAGAADETLRVYFEAVGPYATCDILEAVTAFLNGSVPGTNANFAPPAPVFAGECRRQMNIRLRRDELDRAYRPKLPPPDVERTPESQARVRTMMAEALHGLAGNDDDDAVKAAESKAQWARVNQHFAPDQDERSVAERLGYSVGDADGERDVA